MRSRFTSLIGALALVGVSATATARAAETEEALSVETATPDALCPDLAATRRAVRDRIGQLSLDGGRWVARYTIGHDPGGGGDYVELILKDGAGKVRLERRIPFSGESCDTVAQAIALVLERYFRELQQPSNADSALTDAEPDGAQPSAVVAPPQPVAAARPAPPSATPAEPLSPSLELSALGGYGLGRDTGAVGLDVGFWFSRSLRGSLSGAVLLPQVTERVLDDQGMVQAQARLTEVPLRASVAWGVRRATWAAHVGPELVLGIRHASSTGLESSVASTRLSLAAGGTAGATYWLLPSLGLTALVALDATLTETSFAVETRDGVRSVLISPSPQAWGLLGVTFGVTP